MLYPTYQLAPRLWGISELSDQAAAGAIMWVPGSIAFLAPAVMLTMQALDSGRAFRMKRIPIARVATPRIRARTPLNLLQTPILGSILRYRHFRRCVQTAMLLLAVTVAADGFSTHKSRQ